MTNEAKCTFYSDETCLRSVGLDAKTVTDTAAQNCSDPQSHKRALQSAPQFQKCIFRKSGLATNLHLKIKKAFFQIEF